MASPQIENGYVKIANELLEALMRAPLSPSQWKVVCWIIRNSYGWRRRGVQVWGIRHISRDTSSNPSNIQKAIKQLIRSNMARLRPGSNAIELIKDWEKWEFGGSGRVGGSYPQQGRLFAKLSTGVVVGAQGCSGGSTGVSCQHYTSRTRVLKYKVKKEAKTTNKKSKRGYDLYCRICGRTGLKLDSRFLCGGCSKVCGLCGNTKGLRLERRPDNTYQMICKTCSGSAKGRRPQPRADWEKGSKGPTFSRAGDILKGMKKTKGGKSAEVK